MRKRLPAAIAGMPEGEPRLAEILGDHVTQCGQTAGRRPHQVIVVDHGSPLPEVTAVRKRVAEALHASLPPGVQLKQAVMERRPGADYDFNGHLLEEQLDAVTPGFDGALVILACYKVLGGYWFTEGEQMTWRHQFRRRRRRRYRSYVED